MIRVLYRLFLWCLLLGSSGLAAQQLSVRGMLHTDDSMAERSFTVEVYDTTFQLLATTHPQTARNFALTIPAGHRLVNLIVTSLGCTPYTRSFAFNGQTTLFLPIELTGCANEMEEIVVTARKNRIDVSGDTLNFSIPDFRKQTDFLLGDVLQRLPGITVTTDGQILYQGKRIRQIWVQGYDILNNQHHWPSTAFARPMSRTFRLSRNISPTTKDFRLRKPPGVP